MSFIFQVLRPRQTFANFLMYSSFVLIGLMLLNIMFIHNLVFNFIILGLGVIVVGISCYLLGFLRGQESQLFGSVNR